MPTKNVLEVITLTVHAMKNFLCKHLKEWLLALSSFDLRAKHMRWYLRISKEKINDPKIGKKVQKQLKKRLVYSPC